MHDIRSVRADPAAFDAAMARRGLPPVAEEILTQDAARRGALQVLQDKQARRNALAKEIGQAKRSGANSVALEVEGVALRDEMAALEAAAAAAQAAQTTILEALPNILDTDVPMAPMNWPMSCCASMASRRGTTSRRSSISSSARRWA